MKPGNRLLSLVVTVAALLRTSPAQACCPAPPSGKPVVNADQTVVIVWDAANKTEHFIRRASFKSDADDFGFLVPTPAQPELAESGDEAFPFLAKLTEPERVKQPRPSAGCNACFFSRSKSMPEPTAAAAVVVLDEKTVAGFHAVVLEASSAKALVGWLEEHAYAFSPEVEAWAKPYVDGGWKITALRVAKGSKEEKRVAASSLRLSFKTDRPLFPYREPDTTKAAGALGAHDRLLRIYFVGDGRYDGELTQETRWTGKAAWSNKLSAADRDQAVRLLQLPTAAGASDWWLTEYEDPWPYARAPSDLYFVRSARQDTLKREPIVEYTSADQTRDATFAVVSAFVLPPVVWRWRRRRRPAS